MPKNIKTPIGTGQCDRKTSKPQSARDNVPKNNQFPIDAGQCTENQSEMDNPVKAGIRGSMPLYLQTLIGAGIIRPKNNQISNYYGSQKNQKTAIVGVQRESE